MNTPRLEDTPHPDTMTIPEVIDYLLKECPEMLEPVRVGSTSPIVGYSINYTVCGDYVGNLAYKSNAQCLLADHPWLRLRYSHHNTTDVVIWLASDAGPQQRRDVEVLAETLQELKDYPIIDDKHYFALRKNRVQDAYDEGRTYILSLIYKMLADEAPDYNKEPNVEALLKWAEDQTNWWVLKRIYIKQHTHGRIHADFHTLAAIVVNWAHEGSDAPPLYWPASWAEPTHGTVNDDV